MVRCGTRCQTRARAADVVAPPPRASAWRLQRFLYASPRRAALAGGAAHRSRRGRRARAPPARARPPRTRGRSACRQSARACAPPRGSTRRRAIWARRAARAPACETPRVLAVVRGLLRVPPAAAKAHDERVVQQRAALDAAALGPVLEQVARLLAKALVPPQVLGKVVVPPAPKGGKALHHLLVEHRPAPHALGRARGGSPQQLGHRPRQRREVAHEEDAGERLARRAAAPCGRERLAPRRHRHRDVEAAVVGEADGVPRRPGARCLTPM